MILFAGVFDMIDGRLARVSNTSSKFGAFYDSVLDRYSECLCFWEYAITWWLIIICLVPFLPFWHLSVHQW
jgi:CDP-diacylglycerol--glycerol-3-phosphate 3-phosphatidyltransferase